MLIRVAIVGENSTQSNKLANYLIAFSIQGLPVNKDGADAAKRKHKMDVEVDIGFYPTVESLLPAYKNLDIAFLSYTVLEKSTDHLHGLFQCNRDCVAIPIGEPDDLICRYLAIRPGGHLCSCNDEEAIRALYESCVKEAAVSVQVLRFNTQKGVYAVNVREITYCQSDQKYVQIETTSGTSYRKIEKLDALAAFLPNFWRIHQSYLVNPAFVIGLNKSEAGWELRLDGGYKGHKAPVSHKGNTQSKYPNARWHNHNTHKRNAAGRDPLAAVSQRRTQRVRPVD